MAKPRWKDILWAVQTPPDVCGWMDWATGILHLNEEIDGPTHWKTLLKGEPTDHVKELLQTMTHENVHFLQMATTGYMYQWACQFHNKLVTAMQPVSREVGMFIDDPDPRTLLSIERQVRDADRADLRGHLAQLDRAGPNRVSVRDLLESHAYLVEMKTHWQGLGPPGYLRMLNEDAPRPEYRHAYDLARFRLGDGAAFAYFSLIASLALCAEDPPQAFDILITEMARSSLSQSPGKIEFENVQKLAGDTVSGLLGSSAEVYERTGLRHRVYTAALNAINNACQQGFNILEFFTDPVDRLEPIVFDVIRPMAFRPNAKHQFTIFVPPKLDQSMVDGLLRISVLASRVLGPQLFEGSHRADANGYGWASLVLPEGPLFVIELDQLRRCELGVLAKLDPANLSDEWRKKACSRWGRCLISFNVDGDAPLWTRDEVRRFIAAIERSNPAFPVYLVMDPAFGMFQLWFGSLADPAAFHDQGRSLNLTHPSVWNHLMHSIRAIHQMIDELGFQSRPVIQALLTPYPRELIEEVLHGISYPNSN